MALLLVIDVAVIGGGFAGLIAARELGRRGRSVTVLEARERLGGRTWVAPFAGIDVELGGTFVHWTQPHIAAEMTRYGLGVLEVPDAERSFARTDEGVRELAPGTWFEQMKAIDRVCHDARDLIPNPMTIPRGDLAEAADLESVADRIAATGLPPDERAMVESLGAGLASTTCDRTGYLWGYAKAYALAGYGAEGLFAANGAYTISGGTRALVEAIAADTPAAFRLGSVVTSVTQEEGTVTASTADGEDVTASTLVVALPVNALGNVRFSPELSPIKREAMETGLAGRGVKVWAKLAPGFGSVAASAPDSYPLSFIESFAGTPDGGQVVVGFGPSAEGLPMSDHGAVAAAIEGMLPGARVEDIGGHDWTNDPFCRETWATYAPGTYLRWMPELARMEGRYRVRGRRRRPGMGRVHRRCDRDRPQGGA